MSHADATTRAFAIVLMAAAVGCSSSVHPSSDAGSDISVQETGIDAVSADGNVDVAPHDVANDAANDIAPEQGPDAATTPCSDLRCVAGEICVHQGFVEDGGFRECDRACLPAPATSPGSCAAWGREYCRLACYDVIDGAIYCLCD